MHRLAVTALVAIAVLAGGGAGCYYASLEDQAADKCDDAPEMRFAADPATGVCYEFASSCDIPGEWLPCGPTAPPCAFDTECGMGMGCVNGMCAGRGEGCTVDDECPLTQSCVPVADAATPGVCMDNQVCGGDGECPTGQWCDLDPTSNDCDPMDPMCGGLMPTGLCSRGQPAPPAPEECATNAECDLNEICPAQYGGCSFGAMPGPDGGLVCPSICETACYADGDCGGPASGLRCNASEVCGMPNPMDPGGGVPLPCAGWCVPVM